MRPSWKVYSRPDGESYRQIVVSTKSSRILFYWAAVKLRFGLKGAWAQRLSETDTMYWDLVVNGENITLHLEHYLGISVFPTDGPNASDDSLELLERAYQVLT